MTKLLSAYAFLLALEEEAISLDNPAGPEGSTVHHLLAHTSGYDFDSETIRFKPGSRRGYSNTGFEVLAEHLQRSSGIAFTEYISEALFLPLGMNDTTLDGSSAKDGISTAADLSRFAAELLTPTLLASETLKNATSVHFPDRIGILPGYGRKNPMIGDLALRSAEPRIRIGPARIIRRRPLATSANPELFSGLTLSTGWPVSR